MTKANAFCVLLTLLLLPLSASGQKSVSLQSINRTGSTIGGHAETRAVSQDDEIKYVLDGSAWSKLSDAGSCFEKLILVRGIYDGLMIGHSPVMKDYSTKTSYDHLIKALDQFYGDYRNEKIPVVSALRVISMELRGASKDDVDLELRRLRTIVSRQ